MFSNRYRLVKLALPAVFLAGLCAYSFFEGPRRMIFAADCLNDPQACKERTVVVSVAPVTAVYNDGFTVRCFEHNVMIKGQIPGLTVGQFVDVSGCFHKEGWLEMEHWHVCGRSARWIKLGISLIPLFVVGLLLALSFGQFSGKKECRI